MRTDKIYLDLPRMILCELELSDENLILELDSDPDVMRYLNDGKPSSIEDVRAALQRTQDLYKKHQGRFGFWAAVEKSSGLFMGWFLFRPSKKDPENTKRIEVGYRLKKQFWGKGYATIGTIALLLKGFKEFPIDEVFATTMLKNQASQRVMQKSGLKFIKNYTETDFPGTDKSAVEYGITRSQFEILSK